MLNRLNLCPLFIISSFLLSFSKSNIEFKHFETDSLINQVIWCGNYHETIFALTELNSLYRSDNKGFTWTKLNDIMITTGKNELIEKEQEIGKVSRIISSPVDKNILIFLGTHGINWISTDCGKNDIKALNHGRKIQEYVFHPTERTWGLASAFTLCKDFKNGEPCKNIKELFVTKDLGETWEILSSYVDQFSWYIIIYFRGILSDEFIKAGVPKERILLTYQPRGRGDQIIGGLNYKIDFVMSDDFLKSIKVLVFKGNKFLLCKHYLFVAQVHDQETQETKLLVSNSNSNNYDFIEIDLSFNKFKEHSYIFLDTSENTVFLHVNHFGTMSTYGHIYISDFNGVKYSRSLDYNLRVKDQSEFDKVLHVNEISSKVLMVYLLQIP